MTPPAQVPSPNFEHLRVLEPLLADLGTLAERYVRDDPNTALLKLRQFGEALARFLAARGGLPESQGSEQVERLATLRRAGLLPDNVWQLLTTIRRTGKQANHQFTGEAEEALTLLQYAWIIGIWLMQTLHDPQFPRGEFVLPQPGPDPQQLQALLLAAEQARQEAEAKLAQVQTVTPQTATALIQAAKQAAQSVELSEAQTRALIDDQLREAGWEADTRHFTYEAGTRPEEGRNLAISEWPCEGGRADYVLFIGLQAVGVVEAKRKNKSVYGALEQARRYSRTVHLEGHASTGSPWGVYRVPFLFSTNGRAYLPQLKTESGIWFWDARRETNPSYPLPGWHTPAGLGKLLEKDTEAADARLREEPFEYTLKLRPYQVAAIKAVEKNIAEGQRELLLAMATGTGKTKTAIALIYRLLEAQRFHRVLFLVDRETLGLQAGSDFETVKLSGSTTFANTFNLTGLKDGSLEQATQVHIATVQSLVRRVTAGLERVDTYDLIVVDEAHRGYTLDKELAEVELGWRSESEYVSKYRQVIEFFDAVKIALTATPALHTTQIFGMPVFAYTYREAVLDGVLIDHEPPILIETELSRSGIHFSKGEQVPTYTAGEDEIKLFDAPDDIGLEVEDFNRKVIAKGFNQAVAKHLAEQLNPFGPEKTLIFCVNDRHADEMVDLLKDAFRNKYGELSEHAIIKITGASDRPQELIRHYRNETNPTIAVTVDLLTTGVDVPRISNLVFLRRVGSRILFEQMLGRATRRADDIGKETFRIYDPVGAYEAATSYSTMQPVVQQPKRTFATLAQDFALAPTEAAQKLLRDELVGKLRRVSRHLTQAARDTFEGVTGHDPENYIRLLRESTPQQAAQTVQAHAEIMTVLDTGRTRSGLPVFISEHADQVVSQVQAYPTGERPEDYLTAFERFVRENRDRIPALVTVLTRPSDLTRAELRALRSALDAEGYNETLLRSAYASAKQVDVAAHIIGFLRAAAAQELPSPFEARVDAALSRLLGSRAWTPVQKNWLTQLARQLKKDGILDEARFDEPSSPVRQQMGGFQKLSENVFGGELGFILTQFEEEVWAQSA